MGRPEADIKGGCGGTAAPHVNGGAAVDELMDFINELMALLMN